MTAVEQSDQTRRPKGQGSRLLGEVLNYVAFIYFGLIAGSVVGTWFFKMRVLGFWDGTQDVGTNLTNPLWLLVQVVTLAPGLLFVWLAGKLEKRAVAGGLSYRDEETRNRIPGILAASIAGLFGLLAVVILLMEGVPDPNRYSVYNCGNTNCRDHAAGYAYAEQNELIDADLCALDRSRAFRDGCRYSVERLEYQTNRSD